MPIDRRRGAAGRPRSTGPRTPAPRRAAAPTSWDNVADWYQGWAGETGSKHHRNVAIPAVLEMLQLVRGDRVLDIGAGHGVLAAPVLKAGAEYTGVDASPRLISAGERAHAGKARFLVGDAARLLETTRLEPGSFDAVVFMLSIQDMDPLEAVIASARSALRDGGRLVLLVTHPAFRIPRQSGWGWDDGRKLRYRRVDAYLSRMAIPLTGQGSGGRDRLTRTFHRPISDYVNELARNDLLIDWLEEIPTYKEARGTATAAAENRANAEIPLFMGLRAVHVGG